MKLANIATFVNDKISSCNINLEQYITTDCLLQDKRGRVCAQNLPPIATNLTHYQPGDVLVANIRPYLKKVWFADCEGGTSSDVLVFRAKDPDDTPFLYAILMQDAFYDYAMNGAKGSKMPRGDKDQIMRYEIPTFSPKQRKNIGKFITDIESKIAINRTINDNLEAMAKQLYDYWFVQFDFPNEEGKPYKSSGGKMVWNDKLKREIPEGWDIKSLNDIVKVKDGTHDSPKQQNEGYFLITSKHLLPTGIDFKTAYYISEEDYKAINKRSKVDTNDILFSMIGTIGNKYLVSEETINFAIKNMALIKSSDNAKFMCFLWFYLSSPDYIRYEYNAISGSIQKFLSLDAMRNIPILFNEKILTLFNKKVSEICKLISNTNNENILLSKQRDELLPLLMDGQVSPLNSD